MKSFEQWIHWTWIGPIWLKTTVTMLTANGIDKAGGYCISSSALGGQATASLLFFNYSSTQHM